MVSTTAGTALTKCSVCAVRYFLYNVCVVKSCEKNSPWSDQHTHLCIPCDCNLLNSSKGGENIEMILMSVICLICRQVWLGVERRQLNPRWCVQWCVFKHLHLQKLIWTHNFICLTSEHHLRDAVQVPLCERLLYPRRPAVQPEGRLWGQQWREGGSLYDSHVHSTFYIQIMATLNLVIITDINTNKSLKLVD